MEYKYADINYQNNGLIVILSINNIQHGVLVS